MALRTPIKAIRAKCIDCCCGSRFEVKMCPITDCPLYEYRMGHRPRSTDVETAKIDFDDEGEDFIEEDISDDETPT